MRLVKLFAFSRKRLMGIKGNFRTQTRSIFEVLKMQILTLLLLQWVPLNGITVNGIIFG
jgi:hypothetical protein